VPCDRLQRFRHLACRLSPSPHYRWYIVALTLVNQALALGVIIYSFALFVVPWLNEFEISRSRVMLAIFAFQVSIGLLSPIIGRFLDIHSMRYLVLTGAVLMAAGLGLLSVSTEFWHIVVIYMTLLPTGMLLCGTLASQTMVSKWFTANRGFAIGLSAMGTSIGGLTIPLITTVLIDHFEWHGALLILAIVSLVVLIPLNYLVLRFEPPVEEIDESAEPSLDMRAWTSREILASKAFWIPVIGLIPINAAFGGVQFNLGAYMSDLGYGQSVAAQLIATTSFMMIAGKLFYGSMGDRMDHRKLYWVMALMMIISLVIYQGTPGRMELTLAAGFQGFATGGVMPMMGIMYASRFGTLSFGRVLGYVNMFLMVGSFGSIFSGWIFDLTQSYDAAFWIFAGLILPGVFTIYFLPDSAESEDLTPVPVLS
jgi:MFS family permease